MRIKLAIPDHLVTPEALEAALEATMLADEQAILRGEIPDVREAIRGGVKWQPEPFTDGEHFDLGHEVMRRRWGDCDDLGPWLGASLRASGEDVDARPRVYQSGVDRWHVVTETGDGDILDPSRWAGMGKKSSPDSAGVSGAVVRPFARSGEGALCVIPCPGGRFGARVDVPFADTDAHLASHAISYTPEEALNVAISGAMCCGDAIDSPSLDELREIGVSLLSPDRYLVGDAVMDTRNPKIVRDLSIARKYLKGWQLTDQVFGRPYGALSDADVWTWWSSIGKDRRGSLRKTGHQGRGYSVTRTLSKAAKMASGPLGFMLNPAMALSAKTLTDKKLKGLRNMAANAAIPGSGVALAALDEKLARKAARDAVQAPSVLRSIASKGGGKGLPPGLSKLTIGPIIMRF